MGVNQQDPPRKRHDGQYRESTGGGVVKYPNQRPVQPIDTEDAVKRGLLPENGFSFDADNPDSVQQMGYRKFGPERKKIFLEKLAETGRIKLSALFAGVQPHTVELHRKREPDFDEQCKIAHDLYHELTVALITSQARAGMTDERFDKEGNLLSRRVSYETQIRLAMLKRADPSYVETRKEEVAITGGAVIVPAPTDSVESWEDVVKKYTGSIETTGESSDVGERALGEGRVVKRGTGVGDSTDK